MIVALHLATACTLRCTYCHERGAGAGVLMAPDMAERAVERAFRLAAARPAAEPLDLQFTGGEPLLAEEALRAAVARARHLEGVTGRRCRLQVATNGLLLRDEFLDFAEYSSLSVSLSCDGLPAAHDAGRRRPDGAGSSEAVGAALDRLLARFPETTVLATVTPENAALLPGSFDDLRDRGVRRIAFSVAFDAAWTPAGLATLLASWDAILARYAARVRAGERFLVAPVDTVIAGAVRPETAHACDAARARFSVAPDGTILPCVAWVDRADEGRLGHVDEDVRPEVTPGLAPLLAPPPECDRCAILPRCAVRCACLRRRTTGVTGAADPLVCAHERVLIPRVDALAARLLRDRVPEFLSRHYGPAAT